jgi:1-acyl-sn-glycerol-3-phosphate acyltransferase
MPFEGVMGRVSYNLHYWGVFTTLTLGWSYRRSGRRSVPAEGPLLIAANHQSYLDPIFISLAVGRPLHFLARKNLFNGGWFEKLIRHYGAVPIERGFGRDGLSSVVELLRQDKAVLMFPEGERTSTGAMNTLKPGVMMVLEQCETPVVPVGVAGAYAMWPRHQMLPGLAPLCWPTTRAAIAVDVGAPIRVHDWVAHDRDARLQQLHAAIADSHSAAERIRRK